MDYTSKFRPRLTVMIYFGIGLKCAFPPVNRVNRWNRTRGRGGGGIYLGCLMPRVLARVLHEGEVNNT